MTRRAPSSHGGVMPYTPALIIGAGHHSVAMSHNLDQRHINHAMLERTEQRNTTVRSLRRMGGGYPGWEVCTDDDLWFARTVVIAEGSADARPRHTWLKEPVLDERGEIRHCDGVVADGLYVLGPEPTGTTDIADELCAHLDRVPLVV